jgi:hypothetical protein
MQAPVTIHHADGLEKINVDQQKESPIDHLFESLGVFRFVAGESGTIVISTEGTDGKAVIVDAIQLLLIKPEMPSPAEMALLKERKKEVDETLARLTQKQEINQLVMSVRDVGTPKDGHIHIRGGVRNFGPVVPRGFVQVINRADANQPPEIPEGRSGRLELAHWLASENNPLTARVLTNRIWHHLLGVGIVRTTDNFGHSGERPSPPELLDYLASEFISCNWSVKKLIRRIVLSSIYSTVANMFTVNRV